MMDRYTKIVLTVIAGSLLLLNLQLMRNVDFITNAYAQTGGVQKIAICGKTGFRCATVGSALFVNNMGTVSYTHLRAHET